MKDFHRFHSENGVRTVKGSIGPVNDGERSIFSQMAEAPNTCFLFKISVRMLLKQGYRHVYISRAFAKRNGFIPDDATPGYYGYTGLISIGVFRHPFHVYALHTRTQWNILFHSKASGL
jgi:hypothetical protein